MIKHHYNDYILYSMLPTAVVSFFTVLQMNFQWW